MYGSCRIRLLDGCFKGKYPKSLPFDDCDLFNLYVGGILAKVKFELQSQSVSVFYEDLDEKKKIYARKCLKAIKEYICEIKGFKNPKEFLNWVDNSISRYRFTSGVQYEKCKQEKECICQVIDIIFGSYVDESIKIFKSKDEKIK